VNGRKERQEEEKEEEETFSIVHIIFTTSL
jgi:hypothetical protein